MSEELHDKETSTSLDEQIKEHLKTVKNPAEQRTLAALLRQLSHLPLEQTRAAIETAAAIAAVSLRASIEFLRAVPDAARVLEPAELRAWGELGRRLTTSDIESGVSFFAGGVGDFARVPPPVRPFVFQVCSRQMILSASIAAETFRDAPKLAEAVSEPELLRAIYEIAASISRRSAKHSAEFLSATPAVVEGVGRRVLGVEGDDNSNVLHPKPYTLHRLLTAAVDLAKSFAEQAGGIAADAWVSIPSATAGLTQDDALKLIRRARSFLERGGGAALQVLIAGGEILRTGSGMLR